MSKLYFGITHIYIKIKSIILRMFFYMFGMKSGAGTVIWSKPTISGYLNKITIGKKCCIDERVRIIVNKEGSLVIGDNSLISANVNINSGIGNIVVGSNVMIAANSYIINSDHDMFDTLSVKYSGHITKDIFIEDNVWIGANCTILKGVRIGEGAVIGAGSVVTKNVKPYSVNYGYPCKFIKHRFEKSELKLMLEEQGYDEKK